LKEFLSFEVFFSSADLDASCEKPIAEIRQGAETDGGPAKLGERLASVRV
jgi:hypothetical protein